tara:strand:+ start:234 stop:452 length:219 start_codon:yes stop_codon:yes gene_type:complete
MSAWPDYDGKVINVEFRVSDDPKAAEWLFKQLDKIVDDSPITYDFLPKVASPHPDVFDEFVTGWGDLAEVRN